jgi:hypothetical protein
MKPTTHLTRHIILTIAGSLLFKASASAALLLSGSATIDYDKTAWNGLASGFGAGPNILTLDRYFTQADANALTGAQLLSAAAQPSPSYTGQIYAMNGTSVSNLAGRNTQATNFNFTLGNPQAETGAIGLGGVARFAVSPLIGGGDIEYGDFTLQYSAARLGLGGSGWYLKNNIAPAGAAFDILNVSVVETPTTLSISGDLGVSYEVANFLYGTPSDQGVDVGNFSFTGAIAPVPEPACACFGLVAVAAAFVRNRRSRQIA